MTISTTTDLFGLAGSGTETSLAFAFQYDLKTDVVVSNIDLATGVVTELVLGEQYSITDQTATLFTALAAGEYATVQRFSGLLTRNQFPSQYKINTGGYEKAFDLDVLNMQEYHRVNFFVGSGVPGDQDITTTEKLVMPNFSGVQVLRSGYYDVVVEVYWTPIPTDTTAEDSEITYRLRVGELGDLTSELKKTANFYVYEEQGPTPTDTYTYRVKFQHIWIAAGQKIAVSAEASVADDGDIRIFDGATIMGVFS